MGQMSNELHVSSRVSYRRKTRNNGVVRSDVEVVLDLRDRQTETEGQSQRSVHRVTVCGWCPSAILCEAQTEFIDVDGTDRVERRQRLEGYIQVESLQSNAKPRDLSAIVLRC